MAAWTPKFAYSTSDAAKAIGISRSTLYQLVRRGDLEVLHIGTRALVPVSSIAKLLGMSPSDLVGPSDPQPARPAIAVAENLQATAVDRLTATIAAGAAQAGLGDATYVVTVRRLKPGEKVRIDA